MTTYQLLFFGAIALMLLGQQHQVKSPIAAAGVAALMAIVFLLMEAPRADKKKKAKDAFSRLLPLGYIPFVAACIGLAVVGFTCAFAFPKLQFEMGESVIRCFYLGMAGMVWINYGTRYLT